MPPEQEQEPELVTGAEIARRLGVSRQRVYQWAANPNLGFPALAVSVPGQVALWRWPEVEAWAAARKEQEKP